MEFEDLMINATIDTINVPVNVLEIPAERLIGEFYPNPANDKITVEIQDLSADQLLMQIFTEDGRLAGEHVLKNIRSNESVTVDISRFATGNYYCQFKSDNISATRKFSVVR